MSAYYLIVAGIVIISWAVVLILSSKMQAIFTRPLFKMSLIPWTGDPEKDYQVRVKKCSNDEFGVLVEQFNQMIEEIQVVDDALKSYSASLESRVEQRTLDLTQAKEKLESTVIHLEKAQKKQKTAADAFQSGSCAVKRPESVT